MTSHNCFRLWHFFKRKWYCDRQFFMNGYLWNVKRVPPYDDILIDRTGIKTVAVTEPITMCIYLSNKLDGELLKKVVLHELAHATMFSYNIVDMIHEYCYRKHWFDMEELIANIIAEYGEEIFHIAYEIIGDKAINIVPLILERLVS